MLYPVFFVVVFLSHWTLLRLPYFWDEGGYYIPAALDFFRSGTLIPQSTITNAHPPLPSMLLAVWWHMSGYVVSGTRTLICMVSSAALLAVFRLARGLAGDVTAMAVTLLTAVYPIWFAQSTLAHADIFAAAFTLWGLSFYLHPDMWGNDTPRTGGTLRGGSGERSTGDVSAIALLFSVAALSKETAIVTPVSLALYEAAALFRRRTSGTRFERGQMTVIAALVAPVVPLALWYLFHFHRTGYVFGNPEFLRYNATANFHAYRFALCLWHRLLHLTAHMNMFVPVLCTAAAVLTPALRPPEPDGLSRPVLGAIATILVANWLEFSVLGGALLTRYLLPMYPLILLICVVEWRRHLRLWWAAAALSFAAFTAAIWLNPPYAFAPEDNLTYRDMIVLHQQAIGRIAKQYPGARVLTAWPATAELEHPELGYTKTGVATVSVPNFSMEAMEGVRAAAPAFDTALVFSTKWEPAAGETNLARRNESADVRYFDFHHDLAPPEAARLLHGRVAWEGHRRGEWAAVLRFDTPPGVAGEVPGW